MKSLRVLCPVPLVLFLLGAAPNPAYRPETARACPAYPLAEATPEPEAAGRDFLPAEGPPAMTEAEWVAEFVRRFGPSGAHPDAKAETERYLADLTRTTADARAAFRQAPPAAQGRKLFPVDAPADSRPVAERLFRPWSVPSLDRPAKTAILFPAIRPKPEVRWSDEMLSPWSDPTPDGRRLRHYFGGLRPGVSISF